MKRIAMWAAAAAWIVWGAAGAAEIQLRPRCLPRGTIVLLSDVADVVASDPGEAARLAATELFPAPPPGLQRILHLRELQDRLADRGVVLAEHRFSGSSQVIVSGYGDLGKATNQANAAPLMKQARQLVEGAIVKHLEAQVSPDDAWRVEAQLTESLARRLVAANASIAARGGQAPWTGTQHFEIVFGQEPGLQAVPIAAQVVRLPPVVVAARTIGRGETIRREDVALRRPDPNATSAEKFYSLDEVVGLEASQAIAAGTVLQRSHIRSPILVRRGELIVVYSRAAGIRVRTTARAREDAALGELVSLESLADRKTFMARVSGPQEAEVYARAIQSTPIATSEASPRANGDGLHKIKGNVL